jgi:hypothetical protein
MNNCAPSAQMPLPRLRKPFGLLGINGFEIVTKPSVDWTSLEIDVAGQKVSRPAILEM